MGFKSQVSTGGWFTCNLAPPSAAGLGFFLVILLFPYLWAYMGIDMGITYVGKIISCDESSINRGTFTFRYYVT